MAQWWVKKDFIFMRQTGSDKYKVQPSNLEEEGYKRDDIHDLEEVEDRDDVLPEELKAKNFKKDLSVHIHPTSSCSPMAKPRGLMAFCHLPA